MTCPNETAQDIKVGQIERNIRPCGRVLAMLVGDLRGPELDHLSRLEFRPNYSERRGKLVRDESDVRPVSGMLHVRHEWEAQPQAME
jgi:hypothetical protein